MACRRRPCRSRRSSSPLVVVSVSQPFALLPSQSAKGLVHEAIAHVPVWQVAVALGRTQAWPHAPQFDLVWRFASQPSW